MIIDRKERIKVLREYLRGKSALFWDTVTNMAYPMQYLGLSYTDKYLKYLSETVVYLKFWASCLYLLNLVTLIWGSGETSPRRIIYRGENWRMSKHWQGRAGIEWWSFSKAEVTELANILRWERASVPFQNLRCGTGGSQRTRGEMVFHNAEEIGRLS